MQHEGENGVTQQGLDGKSYRVVFDALKKDPQLKLPSHFAYRVALASSRPSFNWDKFFLAGGCVSFVIALMYAFLTISPSFSTGVFSFVSGYPGLVTFAVFFILVLNWIDRRWISKSTAA